MNSRKLYTVYLRLQKHMHAIQVVQRKGSTPISPLSGFAIIISPLCQSTHMATSGWKHQFQRRLSVMWKKAPDHAPAATTKNPAGDFPWNPGCSIGILILFFLKSPHNLGSISSPWSFRNISKGTSYIQCEVTIPWPRRCCCAPSPLVKSGSHRPTEMQQKLRTIWVFR